MKLIMVVKHIGAAGCQGVAMRHGIEYRVSSDFWRADVYMAFELPKRPTLPGGHGRELQCREQQSRKNEARGSTHPTSRIKTPGLPPPILRTRQQDPPITRGPDPIG